MHETILLLLARHGVVGRVLADGTVEGLSVWSVRDGAGFSSGSDWEPVGPTVRSTLAWLGY